MAVAPSFVWSEPVAMFIQRVSHSCSPSDRTSGTRGVVLLFISAFLPPLQLQAEVERLEALKVLNLRTVTEAIRSEVAVLWEKCFVSSEQRQTFTAYFSGEFPSLIGLKTANQLRMSCWQFCNCMHHF